MLLNFITTTINNDNTVSDAGILHISYFPYY